MISFSTIELDNKTVAHYTNASYGGMIRGKRVKTSNCSSVQNVSKIYYTIQPIKKTKQLEFYYSSALS